MLSFYWMFGTKETLLSIGIVAQSLVFWWIDSPSMLRSLHVGVRLSIRIGERRFKGVKRCGCYLLLSFRSLTMMPRGVMLTRLGAWVGWSIILLDLSFWMDARKFCLSGPSRFLRHLLRLEFCWCLLDLWVRVLF